MIPPLAPWSLSLLRGNRGLTILLTVFSACWVVTGSCCDPSFCRSFVPRGQVVSRYTSQILVRSRPRHGNR